MAPEDPSSSAKGELRGTELRQRSATKNKHEQPGHPGLLPPPRRSPKCDVRRKQSRPPKPAAVTPCATNAVQKAQFAGVPFSRRVARAAKGHLANPLQRAVRRRGRQQHAARAAEGHLATELLRSARRRRHQQGAARAAAIFRLKLRTLTLTCQQIVRLKLPTLRLSCQKNFEVPPPKISGRNGAVTAADCQPVVRRERRSHDEVSAQKRSKEPERQASWPAGAKAAGLRPRRLPWACRRSSRP